MKKYKLLQWYPGLPDWLKEGMNVVKKGSCYSLQTSFAPNYVLPAEVVEHNPKYWGRVFEFDFEVLSFKAPGLSNKIFNVDQICDSDDPFIITNRELGVVNLMDMNINSIKRLSDGEIFSVHEKVIHKKFCMQYSGHIKSFRILDGKLVISIGLSTTVHDLSNLEKLGYMTTKDKKQVFSADDMICKLNVHTWDWRMEKAKFVVPETGDLAFSTKEAMLDYLVQHKPLLSVEDVKGLLDSSKQYQYHRSTLKNARAAAEWKLNNME